MSKVKTVVVTSHSKAREFAGGETLASIVDIFVLDSSRVRMNLIQKENVCPEEYRAYIKGLFTSVEVKSMY